MILTEVTTKSYCIKLTFFIEIPCFIQKAQCQGESEERKGTESSEGKGRAEAQVRGA